MDRFWALRGRVKTPLRWLDGLHMGLCAVERGASPPGEGETHPKCTDLTSRVGDVELAEVTCTGRPSHHCSRERAPSTHAFHRLARACRCYRSRAFAQQRMSSGKDRKPLGMVSRQHEAEMSELHDAKRAKTEQAPAEDAAVEDVEDDDVCEGAWRRQRNKAKIKQQHAKKCSPVLSDIRFRVARASHLPCVLPAACSLLRQHLD